MVAPIIRYAAVAGGFYPKDKEELKDMIDGYISKAKDNEMSGRLKGIVVPHAGYIYSGPVAAYGYKALEWEAKKQTIKKILLIGPSHYAAFHGAAESNAGYWETPLGKIKAGSIRMAMGNTELVTVIPQVHEPEHCLEVHLPFLQVVLKNEFTIFPILTGEVSPAALAEALLGMLDEETIVIASSDLSHYNPYERAVKLDSICNKAIPALDIKTMEESGDACGKTAILTLMHTARKKGWRGKLLDYRNSGDTAGPRDAVVGYGCYAFYGEK